LVPNSKFARRYDREFKENADALEVSRSGFQAHRHKPRRPRHQRDAVLRPLFAASIARSRKTYGPLCVRADLQELASHARALTRTLMNS
jgi:hypothetical protein